MRLLRVLHAVPLTLVMAVCLACGDGDEAPGTAIGAVDGVSKLIFAKPAVSAVGLLRLGARFIDLFRSWDSDEAIWIRATDLSTRLTQLPKDWACFPFPCSFVT